jgi:hypothetical protein
VKTVDTNIIPTQPHYIPSIGTSSEPTIVQRLVSEWKNSHPGEIANIVLKKRGNENDGCFEIKYPGQKGSRKSLDFGFSSNSAPVGCDNLEDLEWVIEFKKLIGLAVLVLIMQKEQLGNLAPLTLQLGQYWMMRKE